MNREEELIAENEALRAQLDDAETIVQLQIKTIKELQGKLNAAETVLDDTMKKHWKQKGGGGE